MVNMLKRQCYEPLPEPTELLLSALIDAGVAVHKELGPGFVEVVYRNAMCLELAFSN
jgi:hypothetical protein